jgi:hypothetical protein
MSGFDREGERRRNSAGRFEAGHVGAQDIAVRPQHPFDLGVSVKRKGVIPGAARWESGERSRTLQNAGRSPTGNA